MWGAEPLGFLRFGSAPLPKLVQALLVRFEGIGRPDKIEVQVSETGREYMVLDRQFGFLYHAWVMVSEEFAEAVDAREVRRIPFLIRKLLEDISGNEKLFVYHSMSAVEKSDITALVDAIGLYGRSTLLWVDTADPAHPPGTWCGKAHRS